jgi:hypothetical protein
MNWWRRCILYGRRSEPFGGRCGMGRNIGNYPMIWMRYLEIPLEDH